MENDYWKTSPFGENSIFHPSWEEKEKERKKDNAIFSNLIGNNNGTGNTVTSKYRVVLLGGADSSNDGAYGSNELLAQYVGKIALSEKYNINLQYGDIRIVNSPMFGNENNAEDIYKEILTNIKKNFNINEGILILYGYSWGAHLLMSFLNFFKRDNINISLLITIDAAKGPFSFSTHRQVTQNVKHNLNIYQTTPSPIGSKGAPNEGNHVKNVNLTDVVTPKGAVINHSNIDEYTLLYCTQVIVYALANIYSFSGRSEEQIKKDIAIYAAQDV